MNVKYLPSFTRVTYLSKETVPLIVVLFFSVNSFHDTVFCPYTLSTYTLVQSAQVVQIVR